MNTARRRSHVLLSAVAITAAVQAFAQLGPSVRTTPPHVPGITSGPKPVLVSPANNASIDTHATQTRNADFSWQAPPGNLTPERYILCLKVAGSTCGSADSAVYNAQKALTYRAMVPPRFHDKTLEWTVAACGPGFGGGLVVQGSNPEFAECSWADARTLRAGYQAQALNLLSPGDGSRAQTPTQRFTWSAPPPGSGGVDAYILCFAADPTSCTQSTPAPGTGVHVPGDRTFADVDIRPFRQNSDRTFYWTVLTCRSGRCGVAANQSQWRFIIGAAPAAPTLLAPAAGSYQPGKPDAYIYQTKQRFPASVEFRWTPVNGATEHKLCIAPPNVTCGATGTHVATARFRGGEDLEWTHLTAFHGRAVNWTVQACDAIGCGPWAAPSPVNIYGTPATPTLTSPASGASVVGSPSVTFNWTAVPNVSRYEIWIGNQARPVVATTNSCTIPNPQFVGPLEWTVTACNTVACSARAQPRTITFATHYPSAHSVGPSNRYRPPGAVAMNTGLMCN